MVHVVGQGLDFLRCLIDTCRELLIILPRKGRRRLYNPENFTVQALYCLLCLTQLRLELLEIP